MAPQRAAPRKLVEIPPDRLRRHAEARREVVDARVPGTGQNLKNTFVSRVGCHRYALPPLYRL
jgi:hypothetical protein